MLNNVMLSERLLKSIEKKLPVKENFDAWRNFLRNAAAEMNDTGRGNELNDCDPVAMLNFGAPRF